MVRAITTPAEELYPGKTPQELYEEYVQRNPQTETMTPLTFDQWLEWQAELEDKQTLEGPGNGTGSGRHVPIKMPAGSTFVFRPIMTQQMGGYEGPGSGRRIDVRDPSDVDPGRRGNNDEVDRLNGELNDLRSQMDTLRQDMETLRTQMGEKDARITELEEENQRLRERIDELENPPPPPGPTPEDLETLLTALNGARDELAKIDIRRSARTGFGFRKRTNEDKRAYETALTAYNEALSNHVQAVIEQLRAGGMEDAEIRRRITEIAYQERADFADRVVAINDQEYNELIANGGFFKRSYHRGLRRWAGISTRNKVFLGLAVGVGVGAASMLSGAGLAALAAGSAMKFSLSYVNNKASARNVTPHSVKQQKDKIEEEKQAALADLGTDAIDVHTERHLGAIGVGYQEGIRSREKKNRHGNYVMYGGAVLGLLGVGHALGVDWIPDKGWLHGIRMPHLPGWPWHIGKPNLPPPNSPWPPKTHLPHVPRIGSGFRPDQFVGHSGPESVHNALLGSPGHHSVFEANGIHVDPQSVTPKAIHEINAELVKDHFHIASGMAGHDVQNIVDWPAGATQNADASALQGFEGLHGASWQNWQKFADIAAKHGVKFTQKGSA